MTGLGDKMRALVVFEAPSPPCGSFVMVPLPLRDALADAVDALEGIAKLEPEDDCHCPVCIRNRATMAVAAVAWQIEDGAA